MKRFRWFWTLPYGAKPTSKTAKFVAGRLKFLTLSKTTRLWSSTRGGTPNPVLQSENSAPATHRARLRVDARERIPFAVTGAPHGHLWLRSVRCNKQQFHERVRRRQVQIAGTLAGDEKLRGYEPDQSGDRVGCVCQKSKYRSRHPYAPLIVRG